MNAILAWAEMLEHAVPADGRTGKGLRSVNRNARALAHLVDDLLDVSRMISGKMRLDVAPIDLNDVVDAAVGAVLAAANAKDVSIHLVVDPASRPIMADATRLQQAVWNLLSNAVKFTPAGGRVEVCTRVDHGDVELAVSDSGIGIDPAFLPYVFDRFRQADASSTRAHAGLGLGLAIVRHGATVHAVTSVNEAIRALPEFNPDLVLSDIAMPGRDGHPPAGNGCDRLCTGRGPGARDCSRF